METNQNDEIEIDLRDLFFALLSKVWAIILTTIVGAVIAFLYTTIAVTPMYSSTSTMYIMSTSSDLSTLSLTDLQVGSALTNDYMVLVTSRPVINKVINDLELDMTYEELVANVTTNNPTNTRFMEITVTNPDAYMAKSIVDDLAQTVAKRTVEVMDTVEPSISEEGTVNNAQVSPNVKKNTVVGGLLGFILAAAIIVVAFLLNDSIKTTDDIEKYLGLNTLGTIPVREGSETAKKKGIFARFRKDED